MPSNDDALSSELASPFKKLASAAFGLHAATKQLSKTIEELDAALKILNLGITSWVEISRGCSHDEVYWDRQELGYAKINGKWGLAIRSISGDESRPEREDDVTEWLYADASRELRIRAVDHLPALIEKLNKDALETTRRLLLKAREASVLAKAISSIPSGPDLGRLGDAVCSALEAAGHHTAAALLANGNWTETDDAIQVDVRIKKTMLGLTMNSEAEKIVRTAAREAGYFQPIAVISATSNGGENVASATPSTRLADPNALLTNPAVKK